VRQAEKKIVDRLPAIVEQMIATALGETKEHLVNHKTGLVEVVPVNPATQLKAQQYLLDRIAGKPEVTKKHELGPVASAGFQVLLGGMAQAHWAQLAPVEVVEVVAPVLVAAFDPDSDWDPAFPDGHEEYGDEGDDEL